MVKPLKHIITFLALTACGATPPPPASPLPRLELPPWDGSQIVCGEAVSFDPANTDPLPAFAEDDRLGLCARTMGFIALHRQYGAQTSYFGVAAETTASLAATYAPMMRRAYSAQTWAFMAGLSADLETRVQQVAQTAAGAAAAAGQPGRRSAQAPMNTRALIREEQKAVQAALDALAREDPAAYATLIAEVNTTLNPSNPLLLAAINRHPFYRAYEAGLAQLRARHGGALDYADMAQRVEISEVLMALIDAIPPAGG